ncbi:MAG: hypothetical protein Q8Q06_02115 [bacterium]|nr:hypothetical protein [bacterium]
MSIQELKKIAESVGGVVVFDGDKPSLIILPFDKYQEQLSGTKAVASSEEAVANDINETERDELKPSLASYQSEQLAQGNGQNFYSEAEEGPSRDNHENTDQDLVEQLNREIEALKDEVRMREAEELD